MVPGTAPLALTLVPAAFGAAVIAVALALPRLSDVLERARQRGRRIGRIAPAASGVGDGVRDALRMVRRLDVGLLGALLWWAGDVAVLWACFEAFGDSPALAVVVMAYFIGMLANTLPLPGGIGGVDGGMVAALVAFGTDPGPGGRRRAGLSRVRLLAADHPGRRRVDHAAPHRRRVAARPRRRLVAPAAATAPARHRHRARHAARGVS